MTVYTCNRDWISMLTCIHVAWSGRLGYNNLRLELEPVEQQTLFDKYIFVEADETKANSVTDAVNLKISPEVYRELAFESMAFEADVLDNIYRVMVLGFAYGPHVLEMTQYEPVMRSNLIRRRLGREVCSFKEFTRFHQVSPSLLVAHIEPKSNLLITLGPAFEDRMPSENWMIVDDVHREAIIHPADKDFYIQTLSNAEYKTLLQTESMNDEYTDMWRVFFDSISIKERENRKVQLSHFPLWMQKHAVEFADRQH